MRKRLLKKYLSRIREIELFFPQEVDGFPTKDIRRLADNCEYDEALEHAEPLLNRRWIDIDVEHWYNNFDSSILLTVEAMAYSGQTHWSSVMQSGSYKYRLKDL